MTAQMRWVVKQLDIDVYGEAPDKMTYTEQANKRTDCKRLTWYVNFCTATMV